MDRPVAGQAAQKVRRSHTVLCVGPGRAAQAAPARLQAKGRFTKGGKYPRPQRLLSLDAPAAESLPNRRT